MAKYLVEMPEGVDIADGVINIRGNIGWSAIEKAVHNAKEAVEVKGSIARAMETQFDKPVVLYAVKIEGEK